jgi:hypothetical protein
MPKSQKRGRIRSLPLSWWLKPPRSNQSKFTTWFSPHLSFLQPFPALEPHPSLAQVQAQQTPQALQVLAVEAELALLFYRIRQMLK